MVLQILRDATRVDHEHLESRIDLLERDWSRSFYQRLLEKFYGFYASLEPQVFAHPEWQENHFEIEDRSKTGLLHNDLTSLGLTPAEIEALPRPEILPATSTFPQALGCTYVMEGSTLGGQIITRHLKQALEITPTTGGAFFFSYGANVGTMWREFVSLLDSYSLTQHEHTELATSARDTFRTLDMWLEDVL